MTIKFKTQNLNYTEDIKDLLCQIDTWIAKQSKRKLDSGRFGTKICVSYDDYSLVNKYRGILIKKVGNHPCLNSFLIDDIITRIKQLLNRN